MQTLKAFGTDALRIWAASCTYTSDTAVGSKVMGAAEARLQRYRILLKFMLGNLQHGTRDISSFAREDLSLVSKGCDARLLSLARLTEFGRSLLPGRSMGPRQAAPVRPQDQSGVQRLLLLSRSVFLAAEPVDGLIRLTAVRLCSHLEHDRPSLGTVERLL